MSPPEEAVQIAVCALPGGTPAITRARDEDIALDICIALARGGWLHDPAEVAALRAVAAGLREYYWRLEPGDPPPPVDALVALADLDGGEVRRER